LKQKKNSTRSRQKWTGEVQNETKRFFGGNMHCSVWLTTPELFTFVVQNQRRKYSRKSFELQNFRKISFSKTLAPIQETYKNTHTWKKLVHITRTDEALCS